MHGLAAGALWRYRRWYEAIEGVGRRLELVSSQGLRERASIEGKARAIPAEDVSAGRAVNTRVVLEGGFALGRR